MTGEIEAVADTVTGVALARAVEPPHGEAMASATSARCLNCAAALAGAYCAQCGQAAHIHRSVAAIGHDFLHSVLHFEGKFWRTLPELTLRPGRLTRRYIQGERARFVSPFALFLFSVFLMFAVSSLTSEGDTIKVNRGNAAETEANLARAEQSLAEAQSELDAAGLGAMDRASLDIAKSAVKAARQGTSPTDGATTVDVKVKGESLIAKLFDNPELLNYKLKTNAYKFSWVLILISIPFVWLLFPFSGEYGIYEHSVFVTYSIAFVSLLFSLQMALSATGIPDLTAWVLFLIVPWHMYRQLKDAYALSQPAALLRLPLLYLFAGFSASLFLALLLALA